MAAAQHRSITPLENDDVEEARWRQTIADCDEKLKRYRAALDAGGDPALIAGWIKETTAIRAAKQAMLGTKPVRRQRLTEDQIAKIVEGLGGLLTLLHNADPLVRTEI